MNKCASSVTWDLLLLLLLDFFVDFEDDFAADFQVVEYVGLLAAAELFVLEYFYEPRKEQLDEEIEGHLLDVLV